MTKTFWRAAIERAIKTLAQTAAALLTASGVGLLDADWVAVASASGMAGLLSLLTSIGSDALTEGDGPSLIDAEVLTRPAHDPTRRAEDGVSDVAVAIALGFLGVLLLVAMWTVVLS